MSNWTKFLWSVALIEVVFIIGMATGKHIAYNEFNDDLAEIQAQADENDAILNLIRTYRCGPYSALEMPIGTKTRTPVIVICENTQKTGLPILPYMCSWALSWQATAMHEGQPLRLDPEDYC